MRLARVGIILLLLVMATSSTSAQKMDAPTDGNGLLEYCSAAVVVKQSPEALKALGEKYISNN